MDKHQYEELVKALSYEDAAAAMNMDMLEYLMEAGAKLHLQERDGWTAADHLEHNIEKMDESQLVLKKMRESFHKLLCRRSQQEGLSNNIHARQLISGFAHARSAT